MNLFWNSIISYIAHPLLGVFLSVGLTKLAMTLLPRFGMVDNPRGRHLHEKPVPCGGGVAIWFAFFITITTLFVFARFSNADWAGAIQSFLRYFSLPALIMLLVGFADDRFELKSVVKLLFQVAVGLIFYFEDCGISMLFGHTLPAALSLIFTVVWCVMIINAFNLIDGLDGLAAGLGAISSFLLAGWSLISGDNGAMVMLLLCFAMCNLGFLRYNFAPAKIFMGDTGSMFIGLFFAYVSMQYSTKSVTFTALMVPLAAVGVPVFDVFLAVWRRSLRKYINKDQNSAIMQGDHDHLHHRILKETGKTGKTALIIYGFAVTLSILAMLCEFWQKSFPALVFAVVLVAIFAMIRYSNVELYDTLSSVARGVGIPHRSILFAAAHPALDVLLVLLALFFSSKVYGGLLPSELGAWWNLLFLLPFVMVLSFSGIYRTYWLRAGIMQYYRLLKLLIVAGVIGYVLNGMIWRYYLDMDGADLFAASSYFLVVWIFASGLILSERFILRYYESFGYRWLFIRNQGKNSTLPRVIIYGGGLSCRMYISSVYCSFKRGVKAMEIIGIMDDNPALKNLNVYGFKVYGGLEDIERIYQQKSFDRVVVACENAADEQLEMLKKFCDGRQLELKKFICTEEDFGASICVQSFSR